VISLATADGVDDGLPSDPDKPLVSVLVEIECRARTGVGVNVDGDVHPVLRLELARQARE
jgi:hypothetical protein